MAKTQLTIEEIESLHLEILKADDFERHEYRTDKYVDYVLLQSKKLNKILRKTYKYEGEGIEKKLINIEITAE